MSASTRNPIHESRHRFDDRFRLIPMHRMAAIRELEQLDIACPTCDARELLHRLILVVFAPHSEDGDANARQVFLDVPLAKFGVEPDTTPTPECRIDVAVMLGKSFAKIGRLVGNLRRGDARDRDFFDEYMRRQKHEATHGATRTASMDQCYGSSVAMSNQYRLLDRKSWTFLRMAAS